MDPRERSSSPVSNKKRSRSINWKALKKLKHSLDIFEFNTSSSDSMLTPAQWIKKNLIGKIAEGKKEKIVQNIRFCVGNNHIVKNNEESEVGQATTITEKNIDEAVEAVWERDFKNKRNQVFVPHEKIPSHFLLSEAENNEEEFENRIRLMEESLIASEVTKEERDKKIKVIRGQRDAAQGELFEQGLYDQLKEYYKQNPDQQVVVIHNYHLAKKNLTTNNTHAEKDFIIVNRNFGYIMNIEAKKSCNQAGGASEQMTGEEKGTKKLLEDWFGGGETLKKFKFISVFYTSEDHPVDFGDKGKFWIGGEQKVAQKLDGIHAMLSKTLLPLKDFEILVKNLLFFTTLEPMPIRCNYDHHVGKSFENMSAEAVDFWNLTQDQMSILHSDVKCVIFTSGFSTGKTMLLAAKAKQIAKKEEVLFIIVTKKIDYNHPILLKAKTEISFDKNDTDNNKSGSQNHELKIIFRDKNQLLEELNKKENSTKSIFIDEMIFDYQE